jgi:hypothetical protein
MLFWIRSGAGSREEEVELVRSETYLRAAILSSRELKGWMIEKRQG